MREYGRSIGQRIADCCLLGHWPEVSGSYRFVE